MKIAHYFITFLCLLSALTVRAESPYVPAFAWRIANNDYLVSLAQGFDQKINLTLPDEIQSDTPWMGVVITNGKEFKAIISLPLKDAESLSFNHNDSVFKNKLRENSFIAPLFPDADSFDTDIRNGHVMLVSTGLSINAKIVSFSLEEIEKVDFGFVQFYPERTLLPTLPPEQENESPFIKKVRSHSAELYQEGKFAGKYISKFWGMQMLPDGINLISEWKYTEDVSSDTKSESMPFSFGGFIDTDAKLNSSIRYNLSLSSDYGFVVKAGTTIVPIEERDEKDKPFSSRMSVVFHPNRKEVDEESKENWHILSSNTEDIVAAYYPKQPNNHPDEEGIPSNAEMDKINEELASGIRQEVNKIGKFLSSQERAQQPFDFACTYDGSTLFLASSNPFSEPISGKNLVNTYNKYWQFLYDHISKMPSRNPQSQGTALQYLHDNMSAEMQEETKGVSDITFCKMDFSFNASKYAVAYGFDAKNIYLAISKKESSENKTEQYGRIIDELEAKIAASKQLFAQKMEIPKTVLSSQIGGYQVRVLRESDARRLRYTAYVEGQSFSNIVGIVSALGGSSWSPFR